MFGLFRKAPQEPVEFTAEIGIDAPIERVFELLDLSGPNNRLAQRGFAFMADAHHPLRLSAIDESMPGIVFHFELEAGNALRRVAYTSHIEAAFRIGALVSSHSQYVLNHDGSGGCHLRLTETSTFEDGLSRLEFEREQATLAIAIHDDLLRLKLHAEQGVEAAVAGDGLVSSLSDEELFGACQVSSQA